MSVMDNGAGWLGYRCRHRGQGCNTPRFSNTGLLRGALLGLHLIRDDLELHAAIRSGLERRGDGRQTGRRRRADHTRRVEELEKKHRKLLELYYADKITADGFHLEELRLNEQLDVLHRPAGPEDDPDLGGETEQFEQVLAVLQELDWERIWAAATDNERRILLDEFVPRVDVHPDHLEVEVRGAPKLNVALHEVGLRASVENNRVEGPSDRFSYRPLAARLTRDQ